MGKHVVCVVDDDLAIRDSLQVLLELEGIEVHSYASAGELLRDAALDEGGCLIIDVNLPDVDGIRLLDRLRRTGIAAQAVLITAAGINDSLCSAADRLSAALLQKPLIAHELISSIKKALRGPTS